MSHANEATQIDVATIAKKVPSKTRDLLYGGYLALAMAVTILAWKFTPSALIPVVVLEVIAGACVALLGQEIGRDTRVQGRALLWAIVIFVVSLLGLFVSTEFFGAPRAGQETFARLLHNPSLLLYAADGTPIEVPAGEFQLPSRVLTEALTVKGIDDQYSRKNALKQRSSLLIEGALVATQGPGTNQTIYVDKLDLEGGVILTNGGSLTIVTNKITSNGGVIRAFAEDPKPTSSGKGQSGGQVKIVVYDHIEGDLQVNLTGGVGAQGAKGLDGITGRNGAEGEHSAQSLFDCKHGGGRGENGAAGGPAGNGHSGFAGGDGGLLIVAGANPEVLSKSITLDGVPARGGAGGAAGSPGMGGKGGSGGAGGGWCGSGESGADGAPGASALAGPEGPAGTQSRLLLTRVPL